MAHIKKKNTLTHRFFIGTMAVALLSPALLTGNELQLNSLSAVQLKENATPVEIVDTYARPGDDVTTYGQVVNVNVHSGKFLIRGMQGATIAVNVVGAPGVVHGDKVVVNGKVEHTESGKKIEGRSVYVTDYATDKNI